MTQTIRNGSFLAFAGMAMVLGGCEVNNPPDTPSSSTTIIHDKTPDQPNVTVNPPPTVNVNPAPNINVTPPTNTHTETHTTTVDPPTTSGSTSTTRTTTTTTG